MGWFKSHLNVSLFLGICVLPLTIFVLFVILFWLGGVTGILSATGLAVLLIFMGLLMLAVFWGVIWWYLGQKARSKWYLFLVLVPWCLGYIGALMSGYFTGVPSGSIIGGLLRWLASLTAISGYIWLFRLENRVIGYGVDFTGEPETWPDTEHYGAPDDRQLKELDYTPEQNVLDISGSQDKKDVVSARDVNGIGEVAAAGIVGEDTLAREKVVERSVSSERLKPPILLDDTGAVIRCFYHPGADAVNLCSRCKQYVCGECNYITGTNPICRNCWGKTG